MTKILCMISLLVSFSALGQEVLTGKYYGEGKAGWTGELEECSVRVKNVYDNGDIVVKSSHDSFFSTGYLLEKVAEGEYRYSDIVDNSGTRVEVDVNDEGEVTYYVKSIVKNLVLTTTVSDFWCEIK